MAWLLEAGVSDIRESIMQNSKTGRNLDGFMGTASHNTSYEGEVLMSFKATFDGYGDKGTCVLIILKSGYDHGMFFIGF